MEAFDPGVPFADPAVADLERTMVARAFASLPQRWQAVLWHTEIEGARPAEVATLLGLTANGVAALAYRAREGLRQAYLQMHLSGEAREQCRPVAAKLGAHVRGGLAKRDAAMVAGHLDQCADCRRIYAELGDVNVALKAIVAPVVLGPAAAAYLASAAGRGSAAAWVTARLAQVRHVAKGQVRHLAKGQHAAVVAAAVATVGLAAAAFALNAQHGSVPGSAAARHALPPAAAGNPPAARGPVVPARRGRPARAWFPAHDADQPGRGAAARRHRHRRVQRDQLRSGARPAGDRERLAAARGEPDGGGHAGPGQRGPCQPGRLDLRPGPRRREVHPRAAGRGRVDRRCGLWAAVPTASSKYCIRMRPELQQSRT